VWAVGVALCHRLPTFHQARIIPLRHVRTIYRDCDRDRDRDTDSVTHVAAVPGHGIPFARALDYGK
jgi:hypothetical protein